MNFSEIEVAYKDHMGSDLTVVNSARVSFAKTSNELSDQDEKLIKYLAREDHFTPFTHPQITLHYKVPIFIARQEVKHQIGFSRNEISRRYVDDKPQIFNPVWRERPDKSIKQGSGDEIDSDTAAELDDNFSFGVRMALNIYNELLEAEVAPEQARAILPQSMMTEYYITGSLAAYARMYNLRKPGTHAQKEIQDLAVKVSEIVQPLYPISWEALTK